MINVKQVVLLVSIFSLIVISSCDENGDLLLFSIEDDMALGEQVAAEIEANPEQFPLLDRSRYSEAYEIVDQLFNEILQSGEVTYADVFEWELFIIDDDETLNAFATPGGKIYVYTGLIYFLTNLDDLVGVLGHEVAHADQRHTSKQLQRNYTTSILLEIILGQDASQIAQIAGELAGTLTGFQFSQSAEAEADDFSVVYLSGTQYACNAAAAFFEKLDSSNDPRGPEFLSTHPAPSTRVEDINAKALEVGCNTSLSDDDQSALRALQNALP